jgi:hypothetical protein
MATITVNWSAGYNYAGVQLNDGKNEVSDEIATLFLANPQIRREIEAGKLSVEGLPATSHEQRTETIGDLVLESPPKPKHTRKRGKKG